jgi:hypothetical protein
MKIYQQEIADGIADMVQTSASVGYCVPTEIREHTSTDTAVEDKIKASSANPDQIDLFYIKSVLVSTGWNKNDDVFKADTTWAARNTPVDKQFNLMHDENNIIGHITDSYVVDRQGDEVGDTQPDNFDIITEAVLYNSWTDPENRQRMNQIIAEIQEGKWFVSMECIFAGFDYALLDEEGNAKLLERNEGSAFLTKHLRAYGGTGEYEGYKIGRSLRDMTFSGKGLVSKPANPRSVILDASTSRAFSLDTDSNILTSFPKGEKDMSDTNLLEKQLAEVQSELVSAKEENVKLREQISTASEKEASEAATKLQEAVAEKEEAIKALEISVSEKQVEVTELQESLEAKNNEFIEKMKEMKKMKDEKKAESRKASLVEAGFEAEEAEESLAAYDALDDDAFDSIIALMKKKYGKVEKKEEEAKMQKPKAEEVETEAEAEEAKAEVAAEEALEEVETTEATLVEASEETDEIEATRASVAEWLENNVLRK